MPRPALLIGLLVFVVALGACGDDDEDRGSSDAAPYEITVGEFIGLIQPDKQEVLAAFVVQSEACQDVKPNGSFTLVVTAAGLDAESASPLPDLIEEQC